MAEYGLLTAFGAVGAFLESAGLAIEQRLAELGATVEGVLRAVGL